MSKAGLAGLYFEALMYFTTVRKDHGQNGLGLTLENNERGYHIYHERENSAMAKWVVLFFAFKEKDGIKSKVESFFFTAPTLEEAIKTAIYFETFKDFENGTYKK